MKNLAGPWGGVKLIIFRNLIFAVIWLIQIVRNDLDKLMDNLNVTSSELKYRSLVTTFQ